MNINVPMIQKIMAEKQVTQRELAKRSEISEQGISVLLSKGSCKAITAGKLAKALDVSVEKITNDYQ